MPAPRIEIRFCPKCRWHTRATWLAQELFTTFADAPPDGLGEIALVPAEVGVFEVRVDGEVVFARASAGRFPEPKELKQAIRDRAFPGRALGHSDERG